MPIPSFTKKAKDNALELLRLGERVATIHYLTGIPERTLQRWQKALKQQNDTDMSQKTNVPDTPDASGSDAAEPAAQPDDYADFLYIREKLMSHARAMADGFDPHDPNANRRSLAITRLLDRIHWLDTILPDRIPEQTIRFEFYYDGQVQEHPPWHGAEEYDQSNIITPFDPDHVISPDLTDV